MARLRWSVAAEQDLIGIADFVAKDSALYAVNVIERILSGAEKLEENPLLGRVVPEYEREDLRELIVGRYRLVYVARSDEVVIARVVHGARELERVLGFEPWRLI